MAERVIVERRFRGPPDSGNGGYVAGLLARALGGTGCAVTLLKPPPLDTALEVERADGGARLLCGDLILATALPADMMVEVPPPPSLKQARAAEARFTGLNRHIFPGCFVCGPERPAGDGLRIFPGGANGQVASTWRPGADLTDADGLVRSEFVWAALDCPGYFAVEGEAGLALLGRLAVSISGPVRAGDELIVTGWRVRSEGRKHQVGTALYGADGRLLAAGAATWITLRAPE